MFVKSNSFIEVVTVLAELSDELEITSSHVKVNFELGPKLSSARFTVDFVENYVEFKWESYVKTWYQPTSDQLSVLIQSMPELLHKFKQIAELHKSVSLENLSVPF